jgi:hypothetical protein
VDFWATLRVVVRRWYAVIPVLLLAVAGVALVYATSPTTYESRAVLLLHTPVTGATVYANGYRPNAVNPLLNSSNNLDITGTVLIQAMHSLDFAQRVGVPDDGTMFTVNNGSDNPELLTTGPFVFVTVDGPTPDGAQRLVGRAVAEARAELDRRQAALEAPTSTYVELTDIVPASSAEPHRGNKLRALGAVMALGTLLSLVAAFAAESVARWRERRRIPDESAAPSAELTLSAPEPRPSPVMAGSTGRDRHG